MDKSIWQQMTGIRKGQLLTGGCSFSGIRLLYFPYTFIILDLLNVGRNQTERLVCMKRILLVEDDLSLVNGLTFALQKQGYMLDAARPCLEAERMWAAGTYSLVILDAALPDGSGFDICRKMRCTSKVPVMFLTAADEETDIIMGLDIGGDDYITKPFKLAVLMSRINALLRRSDNFQQTAAVLSSNGITVSLLKGEVYKNNIRIELTAGEYKLLCMFLENPDRVLSPEQILDRLWDCDGNYIDNSSVTVYIRRLRMKIEDDPGSPARIITVRRMGYKWNSAS